MKVVSRCKLLSHFVAFSLGVTIVYGGYRLYRHHHCELVNESLFGLPIDKTVEIDSTNLPIIFLNSSNTRIKRYNYVTARMKIIDNDDISGWNFGDTISHRNQTVVYDGCIALRYRGNSSYSESLKKPYAICAINKPLEDGGEKIKSSLLGMRKGKKWALLAPYSDRSLIRDALTFELAKKYMEYVPQARFCELVLDGVYRGIYILSALLSTKNC